MKYISIVIVAVVSGLLGGVLSNFLFDKDEKDFDSKIAYIRLPELQQESQLYKQMQEELQKHAVASQQKVDSTALELEKLQKQLVAKESSQALQEAYNNRLADFEVLKNRLQQEHEELMAKLNKKFWDKVNTEAEAYGDENNIALIFGATGNGR